MDSEKLKALLKRIQSDDISIDQALKSLKAFHYEDMGFARVDHHRQFRQGIPEVLFAEGKTEEDIIKIARAIYQKSGRLLITRASSAVHKKLKIKGARYNERSRIISAGASPESHGLVAVFTAGTSDIAVAEEAAQTALFLGSAVKTVYDAGVAGIHRLMDERALLDEANVIVVVAGMEGALPSVVGGLTDKPVIAVPTSTGYGASLGGLAALFAMLNSCVPGIAVMNIDNGFGAGCLAHKINSLYKD